MLNFNKKSKFPLFPKIEKMLILFLIYITNFGVLFLQDRPTAYVRARKILGPFFCSTGPQPMRARKKFWALVFAGPAHSLCAREKKIGALFSQDQPTARAREKKFGVLFSCVADISRECSTVFCT